MMDSGYAPERWTEPDPAYARYCQEEAARRHRRAVDDQQHMKAADEDNFECCAISTLIVLTIFFLMFLLWAASYGISDSYEPGLHDDSSWWCKHYCDAGRCPPACTRG